MNNLHKKIAVVGVVVTALCSAGLVFAFTGPSQTPPTGGGIFQISGTNVGIGISPSVKFHISSDYTGFGGEQFWISGASNTNQQLRIGYNTGSNFGLIQPMIVGSAYQNLALNPYGGNVGIGTTTPSSALTVNGSVVASNFTGSFSGTLAASNVSSGAFGANTGGGNYTFPANVGINSTSPGFKLVVTESSSDIPTANFLNTAGTPRIAVTNGSYSTVWGAGANYGFWVESGQSIGSGINLKGTNLGIGTTSPNAKLEVYGADPWVRVTTDGTGSYTSGLELYRNDANRSRIWNDGSSVGLKVATYAVADASHPMYGSIQFQTSPVTSGTLQPAMTILGGGNVGVGTTTPASPLTVVGTIQSTSGGVKFPDGTTQTTAYTTGAAAGGWTRTGANVALTTSTDYVGIGTASPGQPLTVNGTMQMSSPNNGLVLNTLGTGIAAAGSNGWLIRANANTSPYNGQSNSLGFEAWTGASSVTPLSLTSSGNVGFSTTNPQTTVDVNGAIRASAGGVWASSAGGVQLTYSGTTGYLTTYYDTNSLVLGAGVSQKTGITINGQSASANNILFTVGNSERVRIDSNGNVGIGTSPSSKLQVYNGAIAMNKGYDLILGNDNNDAIRAEDNPSWATGLSNVMTFKTYGGLFIFRDSQSSTNLMTIVDTSGNVGIGTSSPGQKLSVMGSYNPGQILASSDGSNGLFISGAGSSSHYNWQISQQNFTNAALQFTPSTAVGGTTFSTPVMTLLAGGNVGIGTTTPAYTLSVAGSINFTGSLYQNGVAFSGASQWTTSGSNISYSTGNVGIGMTAGTAPLAVQGSAGNGSIDLYYGGTRVGALGEALAYFTGTGHADMGINAPTNLYLGTGGVPRISVLAGGNVGIGKTTAATALDVNGTVTATAFSGSLSGTLSAANVSSAAFGANTGGGSYQFPASISVGTSTTPVGTLDVWNAGSPSLLVRDNSSVLRVVPASGTNWIQSGAALTTDSRADIRFASMFGGTTFMTINGSSGNVGVGTPSPSQKLHVVGASILSNNTSINPDSYSNTVVSGAIATAGGWGLSSAIGGNAGTGTSWGIGSNGSNLYFGYEDQSASNTMQTFMQVIGRNVALVPTSGNVGIGTTTPASALSVVGDARVSGTVYAGAFSGTYSGTVSAPNVSAGNFGANSGGGNYTFPSSISVGTTTSPGETLDVNGSMRIGGSSYFMIGATGRSLGRGTVVSGGSATMDFGFDNPIGNILFGTGSSNMERMRISTAGNVGIGTTNPLTTLQIGSDNAGENLNMGSLIPKVAIMGAQNNTSVDSVLRLVRPTYSGNLYPGAVDFKMSTWNSLGCANGCVSRTLLTLGLKDGGGYDTSVVNDVMSLYSDGRVNVNGTLTATAFSGTYNGTVSAPNVSAGTFGANTGNGNFVFPGVLTVNGGLTSTNGTVSFSSPSAANNSLWLNSGSGTGSGAISTLYFQTGGVIQGFIQSQQNNKLLEFGTNGSTQMAINSSGNVGIGTTSPGARLDIMAPSSGIAGLRVYGYANTVTEDILANTTTGQSFGSRMYAGTNSSDFALQIRNRPDTTTMFYVRGDGNVGIGTGSPAYNLDVNGSGRYSGQLTLSNTTPTILTSTRAATNASQMVLATNYAPTVGSRYSSADAFLASNAYQTTDNADAWAKGSSSYSSNMITLGLSTATNGIAFQVRNSPANTAGGTYSSFFSTPLFTIQEDGKVGIGKINPSTALDVNGTVTASAFSGALGGTISAANVSSATFGANTGGGNYTFPSSLTVNGNYLYLGGGSGTANSTGGPLFYADNNNTVIKLGSTSGSLLIQNYSGTNVNVFSVNSDSYITGGNFGIGTTSPGSNKLYVNGATLINGTLNMNSNNISSVNKLTVATIDPLYDINGKKYATYSSSIAGGVKEEFVGRGTLSGNEHSFILDLAHADEGSDVWVWYKAVDFSEDNVEVFITPYGTKASVWYDINGSTIEFHGDVNAKFSYRLVGKRHDWKDWPTYAKNQDEAASFILK